MYGWPGDGGGRRDPSSALAQAMPEAVPAGSGGDLCGIIYWGKMEDGTFWGDGTDHYVGQGAFTDRRWRRRR